MAYYKYNIATGELLSFSQALEDIIIDSGNDAIETTDSYPDFTQKVLNGALVVDQEKVTSFAATSVRERRDILLAETDWWASSDRTMTQAEIDYRQALRDVPAQAGFPDNITWPTKP